jgi:hypothetical protein
MTIHGTTTTHFYLWQSGSANSVFGDELWDNFPNSNETSISNRSLSSVATWVAPTPVGQGTPVYFEPDAEGDIYLSCSSAKDAFGSMYVTCGPYQEYTGQNGTIIMKCWNSNLSPACKIYTSTTIYWSDNGHFFE